jgi:predicted transcriptional regulator
MKVLLSIKPKFAHLIFEGTKLFEFRKSIFKRGNIKTVVVYASSPMQKVIGEFEIESIINDNLDSLWQQTSEHAGITEGYFHEYFANKEKGFAIKIKAPKLYKKPRCLKDTYNVVPPQSFMYL